MRGVVLLTHQQRNGLNQMTNFDKQLTAAINTYSELSGKTIESIKSECVDFESTTSNIIKIIMFSAR